ncbi:MAG: ethylbenzene dehydrogenase-related protein [Desulfobacula sp.]|nr:ethylbenzene dehydrogenase-related protein [Desulfobacula sp.]
MKFFISILIFFGLMFGTVCYSDQALYAVKVSKEPNIDGNIGDHEWDAAKEIITQDKSVKANIIDIKLKAVYNQDRIFFLVRFPDSDESRNHKNWIWNKTASRYETAPEREDCFVFKWRITPEVNTNLSVYADNDYTADIWYWKAHRTDPVGFADDKLQILSKIRIEKAIKIKSGNGGIRYLRRKGDNGTAAYKTNLLFEYQGDEVRRYQYLEPSQSRGDIRAKGKWKDGQWTIEFSRKLNTENSDDIQFLNDSEFQFGISTKEIAGREPDFKLSKPYFGSGDVSENIFLKLVP